MAIVVLVLWLFTAGAGFYLLVTSNLGRARPATAPPAAQPVPATQSAAAAPATASVASAQAPAAQPASAQPASAQPASAQPASAQPASAQATPGAGQPLSRREMRRAERDRFDPPSLTAAKAAPIVPGLRPLLEFAHPASGIVGLGFWLGYTYVHYRALGWIAFGLVSVTACLGLSWLAANVRAARRHQEKPGAPDAEGRHPGGEPGPSFSARLAALHGGAAAVTFALAVLTVVVMKR